MPIRLEYLLTKNKTLRSEKESEMWDKINFDNFKFL